MSRLPDQPPDQMVNLERSASDTELACDSLELLNANMELHRSMPDLSAVEHNEESHVPPNYYQMCIMDLIEMSKAQQSKANSVVDAKSPISTVASSDSSMTLFLQHLVQEVASLREENFRLVATVLKNNEDIQSLLTKHQSVVGQLEELKSEQCKLQKQNYELEEKLQLNLKETKLLYTDIEQLQAQMRSIAPIKGRASVPDYNRSMSHNNPIEVSGALPLEGGNRLMNRRIEELEVKLQCMAGQSSAICDRLDDCLRRIKHDEGLKEQTEQQLNFMNNLNKLLQLKLLSLETKMQSRNQTTNPVCTIQSKYESLMERFKEIKQFACKVPVPPFMSGLPLGTTTVPPQELPQTSPHNTQTSESSSGSTTSPTSPGIMPENEPPFRQSRRHHRIRLFSHRRRH